MHYTEFSTTRRTVLAALFALCAVPNTPKVTQSATQSSLIPGTPAPKFWFGDRVCYLWVDDDSNSIAQSENGNVVGVCWNPLEKCWQYSVVWTDSTIPNYAPTYPHFDEEQTGEDFLHRAYSEGELCK